MKRIGFGCSLAIAVMIGMVLTAPAQAQATRTWVSGVGDDANPCSRTAPCKTFAGAISKTAPGGEIDVLDPGGFGGVTITKAITIAAEGSGEGGVLVAGTNGITINAGPSDIIILRGLQIDGGPIGSNSLNGVKFIAGGTLMVQNCVIRNFTGGSPNGYGIFFSPSGASSLFVSDTTLSSNGTGTFGGGVFVQPTGSGSAKASLMRVYAVNNVLGIRADGTGSTGGINLTLTDSMTTENTFSGITAFTPAGGANVKVEILNSVSANNGTGVNSNGSAATLRIGYSTLTANGTGVAISNSATMSSLGNNMIFDNAIPGPTIPIVGAQ